MSTVDYKINADEKAFISVQVTRKISVGPCVKIFDCAYGKFWAVFEF